MRFIILGLLLTIGPAFPALAQDVSAVELKIERLRAQLRDVVDREARLQDRAARLDDDLRPENVERSVAAVGTTDATALRARRREDLERQKADVAGQLAEASAKRAGLEAEIAAAEAEAVRLKAAALAPGNAPAGAPPPAMPATPATPAAAPAAVRKRTAAPRKARPRKRSRPRRRS